MATNRIDKFHGNVAAWKALADLQIDYFSQFVKAWIPFNAWFSTTYPNENTDREILSRIKKEVNPFRDKIIFYLSRTDAESLDFLNQIGKLHLELENNPTPSIDRKLSFTNVVIDKNTLPSFDNWVRGRSYNYKVAITYSHTAAPGSQKVNVQVIDVMSTTNQGKMNLNQNDWDLDELKAHAQYRLTNITSAKIRLEIQNEIINCYHQVNPLKPTNLVLLPVRKGKLNSKFVAPSNSKTIDADKNLYFINEPEKIAKGLIEILYNLRNVLFHGEINPSPEVQKIYKEAYYILYPLIKVLN